MILGKVIYGTVTLGNLIIAALFFLIALTLAKVLCLYLRKFLKEKINKEHIEILLKIIYYSIIVTTLITILPMVGVKLSGLMVAGGVVGLAIGFASQSIVANLISGIFLFIERPIKIGNAVNIDGSVGIVENIEIMSTALRTFDGLYLRIPNQKVFTATITNFGANIIRRFEYVVGIRYSDDADKAIKIIKDLIKEQPFALISPEPQVFVDNLGDNSVNIVVRIWAPATEWYGVKTKLLWIIKKTLEQEGIEIPFPQRVVWFGEGVQIRYTPHEKKKEIE
ncbi:MAG: mechanosensitive ion channel family protein [bacterium]